ncbi:MAG TPA: hypothetical protein VIM81_09795 [Gammaproteobacteria bacterium]
MKLKLFGGTWSVDQYKLEEEVNKFLASLPEGAVKHVHTAMAASSDGETAQSEGECIISIWYSDWQHGRAG